MVSIKFPACLKNFENEHSIYPNTIHLNKIIVQWNHKIKYDLVDENLLANIFLLILNTLKIWVIIR